jgi:hypothetical protein
MDDSNGLRRFKRDCQDLRALLKFRSDLEYAIRGHGGVMSIVAPNGRRLRDCTTEEVCELAERLKKIDER